MRGYQRSNSEIRDCQGLGEQPDVTFVFHTANTSGRVRISGGHISVNFGMLSKVFRLRASCWTWQAPAARLTDGVGRLLVPCADLDQQIVEPRNTENPHRICN